MHNELENLMKKWLQVLIVKAFGFPVSKNFIVK